MKRLFLLTISLFLCFFDPCFSQEKGGEKAFVVGTASGYAPYVSLNEKGEHEGFDIDLAQLIAQKLNRKLVIKDLGSMPSLLIALKQKKIDAIIWAMSITQERLKQMEMVYYQGEKVTQMPLLFWKAIPAHIKELKDLSIDAKKTICVEAGSYQESVLSQYSGISLKNVDKITDAIMEIKFGKSLAIAIDHTLLHFVKEQNPDVQVLHCQLPLEQQSLGNGICLNKEDLELIAEVKKSVDELTAAGVIHDLEKKWKISQ
ncbi:MAG: putative transporter arginine-binding protein ArtJ [Chlamydiota bacterium]|jgi:ABC-type amino acid transport substrate-binding protein